jgi:hypothetical protein
VPARVLDHAQQIIDEFSAHAFPFRRGFPPRPPPALTGSGGVWGGSPAQLLQPQGGMGGDRWGLVNAAQMLQRKWGAKGRRKPTRPPRGKRFRDRIGLSPCPPRPCYGSSPWVSSARTPSH